MREHIDLITIVKASIALMFLNELPRKRHYEMHISIILNSGVMTGITKNLSIENFLMNAKHTVVQILDGVPGNIRRFPIIFLLNCWQTIIF